MRPAPELYCRVQTPKGCPLDAGGAAGGGVVCPVAYGYFPDTVERDGRPLEAVVCASQPGSRGATLVVKPVALLRTRGRRRYCRVVLCVDREDPSWNEVESVQDLGTELRAQIERFVTLRQRREEATEIVDWCSREDALTAIDDAAARWAATVNGHG